jgi:hypothetical protein
MQIPDKVIKLATPAIGNLCAASHRLRAARTEAEALDSLTSVRFWLKEVQDTLDGR